MISIRKMDSSEITRIAEIDRTQHITQAYRLRNGALEIIEVDWHIPHWDSEQKIKEWVPIAEGYENMWGAFDRGSLVGFSVYRSQLSDDMAQLAILHISQGYRSMGIGKKLADKVLEKARREGKQKIYVTSARTKATVDFYQKLGFKLAKSVNKELYKLEPDDIHMIMLL